MEHLFFAIPPVIILLWSAYEIGHHRGYRDARALYCRKADVLEAQLDSLLEDLKRISNDQCYP